MAGKGYNNYPFKILDVDPRTNSWVVVAMKGHFQGVQEDKYVRIGPKGYFFPKFFLEDAPAIYNMQTRPDQVFVGGYPRSGTTWTQQVVWLIKHDLDYEECERTSMNEKFKYLEIQAVLHQNGVHNIFLRNKLSKQNIEYFMSNYVTFEEAQGKSLLKTHLPLSLLPPKLLETSKMVYVARDPRDTLVSFYHFCKGGIWPFENDFKTMWGCFQNDTLTFCPYFEHVKEFWEKRHNPNLLFLFYEDIQNDRLNTLRRVAEFFGKSYTQEQLGEAGRYLDFSNLKDNKSFNFSSLKEDGIMNADAEPFVRKGMVGGWREYFDAEMSREAERWIADNLRDTDLRFPTIRD